MRKAVLAGAFLATLGLVIADYRSDSAPTRGGKPAGSGPQAKPGEALQLAASAQVQPLALPERPELAEARGDLFSPQSFQPPPPPKAAPAPPPAPVAPPLPYRFVGKLVQGNDSSIMLAKGDLVFPVKEGETIDGGFKVEAIAEDRITFLYVPLRQKVVLPVASELQATSQTPGAQPSPAAPQAAVPVPFAPTGRAAGPPPPDPTGRAAGPAPPGARPQAVAPVPAAPADPAGGAATGDAPPARLHWEGPQKVRLGARFDVLLKLTSGQPLLASPMQLRFDPAYLELVGMKAGKYFGNDDRNFSYRTSPDGSIYVGASNQNPVAAADAELLILTFKPLKAATAAELSMASLNLHGPAGRPIAFSQPESFKTAIAP